MVCHALKRSLCIGAQESTGTARGYGATLRSEGDNDDEFGFISLVRLPLCCDFLLPATR